MFFRAVSANSTGGSFTGDKSESRSARSPVSHVLLPHLPVRRTHPRTRQAPVSPALPPPFKYNSSPFYSAGAPVTLTGTDLSLAQIAAIARHLPASSASSAAPSAPPLRLSPSEQLRAAHDASRHVITSKVEAGLSIYGVSTGFGGSADTRTDDPIALGAALLQHQHTGVLSPSSASRSPGALAHCRVAPLSRVPAMLPLSDPVHATTMPAAWTRAAMLVRTNSLLRGHSGVRWELVEKMVEVLDKGLVPLVPLRGSISASGGAHSPLSMFMLINVHI